MFKKFFQIAVFLGIKIYAVMANGFIISCPLDLQSDKHLYEDFVQNCGAQVEDIKPENFQITFASLTKVEPADKPLMDKVVAEWVKAHQTAFKGLVLDLDEVRWEKDSLYITTEYLCNALYKLRDQLQSQISSTKFPSKKAYQLDTNSYEFHLFSLPAGTTNNFTVKRRERALKTLQDRLSQAKKIYPASYAQITLTGTTFTPLT